MHCGGNKKGKTDQKRRRRAGTTGERRELQRSREQGERGKMERTDNRMGFCGGGCDGLCRGMCLQGAKRPRSSGIGGGMGVRSEEEEDGAKNRARA